MSDASVAGLFASDRWSVAHGDDPAAPCLVRFRTPLLQPVAVSSHRRCLRVIWPYAEEGSGSMPDAEVSAQLSVFEERLCAALEGDRVAIHAAVLTFDGARQWVLYTDDLEACGQRITGMPQESEAYPIELDAFEDPSWQYLRNDVLQNVGDA